jgi:hypothetical protein
LSRSLQKIKKVKCGRKDRPPAKEVRRMSFDRSRRDFLGRDLLGGLVKILDGSGPLSEEARLPDYFASFESCQPLLADAGEFLYEEAARLGIEIEGRTREDIAREVFSRRE